MIAPALSSPPAIVLAHGLNGLGTVRSLGAAGVATHAIVRHLREPVVGSRFARVLQRRDGEPLPDVLDRLRADTGIDHGVLMATSDDSALELAVAMPQLAPGWRFAGPPRTVIETLRDKRYEIDTIRAVANCLPRSCTRVQVDPDGLVAALGPSIIFKPRTQRDADRLGLKNRVVHTRPDLERFLAEFAEQLDSFVAQEVIPGADGAIWQCNAVFDADSTLHSAFTFRKLGMSPPHFGVTTLGQAMHHPGVIALAEAIGRALGYTGPAGFEFKEDARDRSLRYIEINPRASMSNWFDSCCGVNTTYRSYRVALGQPLAPRPVQRNGAYFISAFADWYSRIVDDGEPCLRVLGRYASLAASRRVYAYWSWRDPVPGVRAAWRHLGGLQGAFVRRRARVGSGGAHD